MTSVAMATLGNLLTGAVLALAGFVVVFVVARGHRRRMARVRADRGRPLVLPWWLPGPEQGPPGAGGWQVGPR